ncbi:MAG: ABC transporter permease [Dehalococcoidia bacterium]
MGDQAQPKDNFFAAFGRGELIGVPAPVIILSLVALVSFLLLSYTTFGRQLYAVGASERSARLSGVHVDRIRIATYVLSGGLAGLAGLVRASNLGHAERTGATVFSQGTDLLDAVGAVLIGGAALSGGIGTVGGTVAGALIIGFLNSALTLHGAALWVRLVCSGGIIILAVAVGSLLTAASRFGPTFRQRLWPGGGPFDSSAPPPAGEPADED